MADGPLPPNLRRDLSVGVARLREHYLNLAELLFVRVLEAEPNQPDALHYLGLTLFKLGRRNEALSRLHMACQAGPSPARWSDFAVALQRAGRRPAAAEAWRRAGRDGAPPPDAGFTIEQARRELKLFDYDYVPEVRYGEGRPPHPELAARIAEGRDRYAATIEAIGEIQEDLAAIPLGGFYTQPDPFWLNVWYPPLDGMVLTQMLRAGDPARFVEVGSGVSTKFARRAVNRFGLSTRLISIDPEPRNDVDQLCDEVIRRPLEAADLALFEGLQPGEILFLDSSHRSFQGSDVTVFFLDILPRLQSGVLVHLHDIYLPDDYISGHLDRMWNEQYLLAVLLLFGEAFEIVFPGWFAGRDPQLRALAIERLCKGPLEGLDPYGASFWLKKR